MTHILGWDPIYCPVWRVELKLRNVTFVSPVSTLCVPLSSCPPPLLPTLTSSGTRSCRPPITIRCRYQPPPLLRSSAGRISNRRPGSYFTVPGARCCHVLIRIQIPRIDCVIRRLQPRPRASIRAVIYCYLHKKKKRKNPFV